MVAILYLESFRKNNQNGIRSSWSQSKKNKSSSIVDTEIMSGVESSAFGMNDGVGDSSSALLMPEGARSSVFMVAEGMPDDDDDDDEEEEEEEDPSA